MPGVAGLGCHHYKQEVSERSKAIARHFSDAKRELCEVIATGHGWPGCCWLDENVAPGMARSALLGEVSERSKAIAGHFSDAKRELCEVIATGHGWPGCCW